MPEQDNNFKIVFLGDPGVGKTALLRAIKGEKFPEIYNSTAEANFFSVEDGPIKYNIWDLTGNDRYSGVIPYYLTGAHIVVYVLDSSKDEANNKLILQKYRTIFEIRQCHSDIRASEVIVFNKINCLPTSSISENYIKAVNEPKLATIACLKKESPIDETEIDIKESLLECFRVCIPKITLNNYCTKIINYLNSSVFDKEKIKEVSELIQLVENHQANQINSNQFQDQANLLIKQIYEQIPKQSLAWKLLNEVACLIALILTPLAIANYVYNKKVTGRYKLSFFDNLGKSQEVKDLNELKALITPKVTTA